MILIQTIYWLAGVLEGEGSFFMWTDQRGRRYPKIQVGMTDPDVIDKIATLFQRKVQTIARKGQKTTYRAAIEGRRAAGWMMTIYPLMGQRRRERIAGVLKEWRGTLFRPGYTRLQKEVWA